MRALAFLLLLALPLSGCAADGEREPEASLVDEGEFAGLDATETTGVIRGVVVDEAVRPLPDAVITLTGSAQRNATTSESGAFGFDGLEPGTYFLTTNKPGYFPVQTSAEVVAGVADPPIVKVTLLANPDARPYYTTLVWNGFIECSGRVAAPGVINLGVNGCSVEGGGVDPFPNQYTEFVQAPFDAVPQWTQAELIWESTQTLGSGLSLVVGPPSCVDVKYARADGDSPQVVRMNETTLLNESAEALDDGFVPEDGICWRVFSWLADESQGTFGLVTSQRFDVYIHTFYNMVPPDGWQFSLDGEPPMP